MTLSSATSRLQSDSAPPPNISIDTPRLNPKPSTADADLRPEFAPPITTNKSLSSHYRVTVFSRAEDPDRALRVEQIHGEAYVAAGYVHATALDEFGRLDNSNSEFILDKARDDTQLTRVLYLHAVPKEQSPGRRDEGGLRVVTISDEASLDDLGAFRACKPALDPIYQRKLYDAVENYGTNGVKEITSLSLTNDADSSVSYALIRAVLHRGFYEQTNETWLITFAMHGYLSMRKRFGDFAMPKVGEPFYAHRNEDPRTSNDLLLVPSIVDAPNMLENIARSAQAADDPHIAARHLDTLHFMATGLDDTLLTPRARTVLRDGL